MNRKGTKTIVERVEYEISGSEIIDLLTKNGLIEPDDKAISVKFRVPTGGDYSGMVLDVDSEDPLLIRCIRETTEAV